MRVGPNPMTSFYKERPTCGTQSDTQELPGERGLIVTQAEMRVRHLQTKGQGLTATEEESRRREGGMLSLESSEGA